MNIQNLIERIHNQNKEMGWWDNPRNEETLFMLIISEVAEAMEGARKDCMDDHLKHRKMFEVEMADVFIRCCDFIGYEQSCAANIKEASFDQDVMEDHISRAPKHEEEANSLYYLCLELIQTQQCITTWEKMLAEIIVVANSYGCDLFDAVEEKLEYNRSRADHQKANREKDGGKKW